MISYSWDPPDCWDAPNPATVSTAADGGASVGDGSSESIDNSVEVGGDSMELNRYKISVFVQCLVAVTALITHEVELSRYQKRFVRLFLLVGTRAEAVGTGGGACLHPAA